MSREPHGGVAHSGLGIDSLMSRAPELAAKVRPAAASDTADGWLASLELQFEPRPLRTRLSRRRHVGPLMVQRVFYPERSALSARERSAVGDAPSETSAPGLLSEPCHVYILHPPGGVVCGDRLDLKIEVIAGAHALLTSPAAGKFYRRGVGGLARIQQNFDVHGALEWLPHENIYYPEAAVELRMVVQLGAKARFIGWEIGCLGLPSNGLSLGEGKVGQSLELWRGNCPLLIDRLNISADCLDARWGLDGRSSFGTWIGLPADPTTLAVARRLLLTMECPDITVSCTLVDGVLICRGYARRADRMKQCFVDLWSALRPSLLGREAVQPRIWMT